MTDTPILGSCHCGAVHIEVAALPEDLNDCQCERCQKRGALWAYYQAPEVKITGPTTTYRWGEHPMIDFHFCPTCGLTTHWTAIDRTYQRMGINGRLFGRDVFQPIPQRKSYPGGD
jgi:hypothetical protein